MNILDQLKAMTTVVADTGDFESMERFRPRDATTNPSLIVAASGNEHYRFLIEDALEYARSHGGTAEEKLDLCIDRLFVDFGVEILKIVPGRVSSEVDASLSFDTEGSIARARRLIAMYDERGIGRERILIKLASTWEGIQAAKVLEAEGIHCNLTLLFAKVQAVACGEAGVTLISPFVGRIYDWYKKSRGVADIPAVEDPGVLSVTEIYHYFKSHGFTTEIMGASFRNSGEIIELAGCDLLTISPALLAELEAMEGTLERRLDPARITPQPTLAVDEKAFRWLLNEDPMATEKLADGIRRFNQDLLKLKAELAPKIA